MRKFFKNTSLILAILMSASISFANNYSIEEKLELIEIENVKIDVNVSGEGTLSSPIEIKVENLLVDDNVTNLYTISQNLMQKIIDAIDETTIQVLKAPYSKDGYRIYTLKSKSSDTKYIVLEIKEDDNNLTNLLILNLNFELDEDYDDEDMSLPTTEFSDIKNHWAKNIIEKFLTAGYINGMGDNTFKPNESITRAQFITIVNKYFGYTQKAQIAFMDVSTSDWYYDQVAIAVKAGYIQGRTSTAFDPTAIITRQEAAEILTNIKNNKDATLDKLNQFSDASKASKWAQTSLEGAIEAGYLQGSVDSSGNKVIRPTESITRAEAVTMISRVTK